MNEQLNINLDRLKSLIDTKTRKQIAEALKCNTSTVTKHYNGDRRITIDYLIKYAQYFNVSADYLLGLSDSPTNDTAGKMIIEQKYLNVLNTYVYDERLKQKGIIRDIVITILNYRYSMYYTVFYSERYPREIVFYEDFVKQRIKFVVPAICDKEERKSILLQIKDFLGKDYSEKVICDIDKEE